MLQLTNGKYYVGKTTDMNRRYQEHKAGNGSSWTSKYKPVKIMEVRPVKDAYDENNTTKDLMKKYGIDNVRGGSYTQVELPQGTKNAIQSEIRGNSNACFKCGEHGHFARDCEQVEVTVYECSECHNEFETMAKFDRHNCSPPRRSVGNCCYRCGRQGHWAEDCYAHTTADGDYIRGKHRWRSSDWIVESSDEEDDEWD